VENPIVVLVTTPSREVGREIGRAVIERKVAACVNVVPTIESLYTWEGELCSDEEALLLIKTTLSRFDELCSAIRAIHPYDVPEIIAVPVVAGSEDYLEWIETSVEG
jgi:periplasmic divalent cation tolerance protein